MNGAKHSVFVSSTFIDLADHRSCVQSAIRQLGAVDVSMENFGARDERPKAECLRILSEECDAFVGIYAHRYGFVAKGDRTSIIECEYDAAGQHNLQRFIYLVNEDAPWSPRLIETGAAAKKLALFKGRLRTSHICKVFSNKDDLATSVAADLGRHFLRTALVRVTNLPGPQSNRSGSSDVWSSSDWNKHRYGKYTSNRDLFLVHSLAPSSLKGQLFDIFIYLQRHRRKDLSDVSAAEFFLGPYWGDQIFTVQNKGEAIGIAVSAYGEFLCVCRVRFVDGSSILLDRYINFSEYARDDA